MADRYVGSTKWTAVTQWAASTAYSIGDLRRQLATPAVNSERVFRCTTAGTSGGTEPTWVLTAGATTNDGSAVWTEVTGNSTYGWNAAHARIANALASGWSSAGDTIYVSHNHAETQASSLTLTSPGTPASPITILCVNDGTGAIDTTASVSTTSTSAIVFGAGYTYVYGIIFNCASGNSNASISFNIAASWWRLDTCNLKLTTTSTSPSIQCGVSSATHNNNAVEWVNCTVQFGNVSQSIVVRDSLLWLNSPSAITGATIPTTLFKGSTNGTARVTCLGVDFSSVGSGKSIVDMSIATATEFTFIDCRLGASAGLAINSPVGQSGTLAYFINCDGSDTQSRYLYQDYTGSISQETATYVRTGGASDGTTSFSRKFVTTGNSKFFAPLYGPWFKFWNTTLSSQTVSIEILTDNVTLKDDEAWIEVEYQGGTNVPDGKFVNDRAANILTAGVAQATSSEVWTTTGMGTPVTQVLTSPSFTPTEIGWIRARAVLAKPSTTMYACPKILSTSAAQRMTSPDGDIINTPAGLSSSSSSCFIF